MMCRPAKIEFTPAAFNCVNNSFTGLLRVQTKESLRSDSRYKVVKRDEREELFNAIIAELRAAELEVEKAAKAKKEEEVFFSHLSFTLVVLAGLCAHQRKMGNNLKTGCGV